MTDSPTRPTSIHVYADLQTGAHATDSDEFVHWWLPTLGPTATLLARELAASVTDDGHHEWQCADLALLLGLGDSLTSACGVRSNASPASASSCSPPSTCSRSAPPCPPCARLNSPATPTPPTTPRPARPERPDDRPAAAGRAHPACERTGSSIVALRTIGPVLIELPFTVVGDERPWAASIWPAAGGGWGRQLWTYDPNPARLAHPGQLPPRHRRRARHGHPAPATARHRPRLVRRRGHPRSALARLRQPDHRPERRRPATPRHSPTSTASP